MLGENVLRFASKACYSNGKGSQEEAKKARPSNQTKTKQILSRKAAKLVKE